MKVGFLGGVYISICWGTCRPVGLFSSPGEHWTSWYPAAAWGNVTSSDQMSCERNRWMSLLGLSMWLLVGAPSEFSQSAEMRMGLSRWRLLQSGPWGITISSKHPSDPHRICNMSGKQIFVRPLKFGCYLLLYHNLAYPDCYKVHTQKSACIHRNHLIQTSQWSPFKGRDNQGLKKQKLMKLIKRCFIELKPPVN